MTGPPLPGPTPLRDGDVGHVLRNASNGVRYRNDTLGIVFQWDSGGWWRPVGDLAPNGCRHCGVSKREHCQLWSSQDGIGWHGFIEPTDVQRLERMQWRRILAPQRKNRRLP